MPRALVAVVIVAWNRKHDTLECLESLRQVTYRPLKVFMVDNGSTDGTVPEVAARYPEAEIIQNGRNLGFAAGTNRGWSEAIAQGADYVFFLNNDTVVDPTVFERLLRHDVPDVGLLAPKVYYAADRQRLWSIGGLRHMLTFEKIGDARGVMDTPPVSGVLDRDYVTGCALLAPRRTFEHVGQFDERFFMYYEDNDLCWRVRAAGLRIMVVSDAHIWHKVAISSGGADSPNERYWMARSSVIFFRKYVKGLRWFGVGPYRLGSAVKTSWSLIRHGRFDSIHAYWRGLRDGWWTN